MYKFCAGDVCALQPTPMAEVDEFSDESRCSTCTCESCVRARYCHSRVSV